MRRRGPVPYVDLPGPAHVRHRPVLPRSPAERSRRPLRPARPSAPVLPLVEPVPVGPCALPNAPASPLTSQPPTAPVAGPPTSGRRRTSSSTPEPVDPLVTEPDVPVRSSRADPQANGAPRGATDDPRHGRTSPEATTSLRRHLGRAPGARLRRPAEPVLTGPPARPADDDPVAEASTAPTPRPKRSSALAQGGCVFAQVDLDADGGVRTGSTRVRRRPGEEQPRRRPQAASRSRMSSAPSSPPPRPSASKTEPKSSALRALSAITFSSMVSLATIR